MAIGVYGTVRPSDVSPEDVEIIMVEIKQRVLFKRNYHQQHC
jgi:hypothetical protein